MKIYQGVRLYEITDAEGTKTEYASRISFPLDSVTSVEDYLLPNFSEYPNRCYVTLGDFNSCLIIAEDYAIMHQLWFERQLMATEHVSPNLKNAKFGVLKTTPVGNDAAQGNEGNPAQDGVTESR